MTELVRTTSDKVLLGNFPHLMKDAYKKAEIYLKAFYTGLTRLAERLETNPI